MKTELEDGRFLVHHVGNEKAGIKGTGKKQHMSEEQFDMLKHKGWEKVPSAPSPANDAKTETGADSGNQGETSMDYTATDAIAKIKVLGDAEDIDGIKAFIDEQESRVTVLDAAERFTNPQED